MSRFPRRSPRHPRYSIVRRLGSGGSSTVYLARDLLDDGREVALKVCRRAVSRDLLGEFRILRELRHPGIARAFDFGKLPGSGSAYFTLEYVAGPDLEKQSALLRRGRRRDAVRSLLGISIRIVEALEYLHGRGLLHLDLKPANVVLSGGGAKLIDFGLFQNAALEGAGLPRGTAAFTAPEVFDGRAVDRRTDLYSLGVTLYRAFTGRYPIRARTLAEIAEAHRRLPPRPPAGVPPELGRIILKLLAKSPEHRFQDAAEVGRALRGVLADGSFPRVVANEPDLTGRKEALDSFFGWFDAVRGGHPPRLLLVEGEAGAGKSRFARACVTEMLGLGARVIPLGSLGEKDVLTLEALVRKALVLQPATRAEKRRHRFLFTSLGIEADPRSRSEILDLDLDQIRNRTYQEMVDLLAARASVPLVFVLDDAGQADVRLLDFLGRWAKDPWLADRPLAVGILATSRPGSGLARGVDDPSGAGTRHVRLARLTRVEVVRALRSMDPEIDRATLVRIARRCRGNPGLAVQELRAAGERTGAEAADRLHRILEEIRSLEPDERSLLLHVSLLARPAGETFLRAVTGLAPAAFRKARLRLEKAGLLEGGPRGWYIGRRVPEAAGGWEAGPGEVRAAHERIGLRLLEEPDRRGDAAHHLLAAGRTEEGLRAAEAAGRDLRAAGRVEDALALVSEALAFSSGAARWRILEELGGLEEKSGRFDEAAKRFEEILSEPDLPSADRPRILRKLGGVEQRRGVNAAAERAFEGALQLIEAAQDIEEHLHVLNEVSALYLFRGEYSRASNFANRGLELLGSSSAAGLSPEARAFHALNLHSSAGHIFLRQFEYERATEEFLRGLRFAEEIGSLSNAALILNNLGIAYHQSNRLRKALRVYARATSIARRLGDGTTLFSILCNVAAIRARMGEMQAAAETLREIEAMPAARRSSRARLFFLHSKGLVEKLALEDARSTFEESVRIAEDLPDPLFARWGRMLLFENEIHQGRWASARKVLATLVEAAGKDPRLDRALAVRRAWLEALCGRGGEARALLEPGSGPGGDPHYADLWDRVHQGAALAEIGSLAEAEAVLESAKRAFDRSSQLPGSLECALLLAGLDLRALDREGALLHIKEARRILALHDTSRGSRRARAWIPFLEARAALLSERPPGEHVSDRLEEAAGNLGPGATAEISWLIDLVAAEHGDRPASRRLAASRRRFASLLAPADRKAYLSRDHRARLGLAGRGARTEASAARRGESAGSARYDALLRLRHAHDPGQALETVLAAARAPRGAIFLDGDPPVAAARGLRAGKALAALRLAALRARSGRAGGGLCASFKPLDRARSGVLYVEPADDPPDLDLPGFLEVAAQVLGAVLPAGRAGAAKPSRSTPTLLGDEPPTLTLGGSDLSATASPRMKEIVTLVQRIRDSRLPVLITGESGVGKDHLARWIHASSSRGKGPFVAQDCSAIPAGLVEAEIFGHEAGAFTGAERARTGYLFAAEGGTFYVDNVDSLPLEVQAKLLRVLEEEAARPLGAGQPRRADVRFMASSQRDLKGLSLTGGFRRDLYFRLAGIVVDVPPLRERAEDIPLLIRHFQRQLPGGGPELTAGAIDAMKAHPWPGNVRELESVVRRLALTTEGAVDEARVAGVLGLDGAPPSFPRWFFEGRSYHEALDEVKREYLLHLFERFEGNLDRIARELGTTKRNVYLRFSQAGIRPVDLRQGPG